MMNVLVQGVDVSGSGSDLGDRLKPAGRRMARSYGRLTSGARVLPSFLLVGAQRSGTTSLWRALADHPSVLPAVWHKGVHYFDTGYDQGLHGYRAHFPLRLTAERVTRGTGTPAQAFESSPYYMFHPLAPERIARELPDVHLLVLLRDPVDRAYSAYAHELARGYENVSFPEAIELEPERLRGEQERILADPHYNSHRHQHNAYVARGQYVDQLQRLEKHVGRDRLHVIDSNDFFTAPAATYADALRFLQLPLAGSPSFGRHNARDRAGMPASLRRRLSEHFQPYDERLAEWLGVTPSWRRRD